MPDNNNTSSTNNSLHTAADTRVVIESYALVIVAIVVAMLTVPKEATAVAPVTDFSKFALFYIVAQAIERFLEPATKISDDAKDKVQQEAATNNKQLNSTVKKTPPDDKSTTELTFRVAVRGEIQELDPTSLASLEKIRANTRALLWASATVIAMLLSALLNLYLLRIVGVNNAPPWLDVVVTGLAIGAGTQPLHELISRIEKKTDNTTTVVSANSQ